MTYHTRDELNSMVDNDHSSDSKTPTNYAGGIWVHPALKLTPLQISDGVTVLQCPDSGCGNAIQLGPMNPPESPTIDEYLDAPIAPGPDGVLLCSECDEVVFGAVSCPVVEDAREEYGDTDVPRG